MPLFSRNTELGPPARISSWRKIAIGTWRSAGDPSIYGTLEIDVTAAQAYIDQIREKTELKITLTHFTGKALADTIARHPDINCILRWGRLYPRRSVDIFFQVASDTNGKDLSGMVIRNADRKSMAEIAREMQERVERIRSQGDPEFRKMKRMMGGFPGICSRALIGLSGLIMYTLNLWTPLLGVPRDPFGSAMVTSIGSLGLDMAFAPLVPYSRVPLLIALGAARETPVVREGKLAIAPVARICATIDHRVIDGVHASHLSRTLQQIFADPSGAFGQ